LLASVMITARMLHSSLKSHITKHYFRVTFGLNLESFDFTLTPPPRSALTYSPILQPCPYLPSHTANPRARFTALPRFAAPCTIVRASLLLLSFAAFCSSAPISYPTPTPPVSPIVIRP
jgi:hypothetical protein